jgi:hypothetical protein
VNDKYGDVLADSHKILNSWKNYFSRQLEIHNCEMLIPGPGHLEFEIAIAKLKKYISSGSDQILVELIQAEGEHYCPRFIKGLRIFGIRKNCHISRRSPIHKNGDKNNSYEIHTNIIPYPSLMVKPIYRYNYLGS